MDKLKIGGIDTLSMCDTDGIALGIYFQGCPFSCKGCHNPELQPFGGGYWINVGEVITLIIKNRDWYDSIAIMGGEPLAQKEGLLKLLKEVKKLEITTWLYTGFKYEKVPEEIEELCDVMVTGQYIEELRTGRFPASSNQKVIRR